MPELLAFDVYQWHFSSGLGVNREKHEVFDHTAQLHDVILLCLSTIHY